MEERDELLRKIHEALAQGIPPHGYVETLKKMDGPFVRECERAIKLAQDMAGKWLRDYMMKGRSEADVEDAVKFFSDPKLTLGGWRIIGDST